MLSSLRSSSPFSQPCSTPSRSSYYSARSHQPINSSPLASPTNSSPTHQAQERRRAQYKSTTPASHRSSAKLLFHTDNKTPVDSHKTFLRERLQARCRQHAQKQRERAVSMRRSSDKCSDVFMECDDEEESDDVIMQDELFRRIMSSASHRMHHAYRVSYALEVGSSFDPDMEDAARWESELREPKEITPDDLEEEELREYAEQCAALNDEDMFMYD